MLSARSLLGPGYENTGLKILLGWPALAILQVGRGERLFSRQCLLKLSLNSFSSHNYGGRATAKFAEMAFSLFSMGVWA